VAWLAIGRVVRAVGLKGWLGLAGTAGGLATLRRIALRRAGGEPVEHRVLEARPQGRVWAVRLQEVADRADLGEAGPGRHYWADLEALPVVTVGGAELGKVTGVYETGGVDVLVVTGRAGEVLVPLAPYVTVERDRLVVDPPEGLLEPAKEEGTTRGPRKGR